MNTVYQLTSLEILGISFGFFILGMLFVATNIVKRLYWIFVCAFWLTLIASASTKGFTMMFCYGILYLSYVLLSDFKWKPTTLAASDLKVQINQHIEYETRMDEIIDELSLKIANLEDRGIW